MCAIKITDLVGRPVTETVEDYQIRRIKWAVKELNLRGEEAKEWKILRVAGLREVCDEKVRLL